MMFAMFASALTFSLTSSGQLLAYLMETVDERMVRHIDVGFPVRYWAKQRGVVPNSVKVLNEFGRFGACLDLRSARKELHGGMLLRNLTSGEAHLWQSRPRRKCVSGPWGSWLRSQVINEIAHEHFRTNARRRHWCL